MGFTANDIEKIYKIIDERVSRIEVRREDFTNLIKIVEELAEAQKRTEVRVGQIEARVAELAEAQKRTEVRVAELAEAQKRTELNLVELVRRVEELAEESNKVVRFLAMEVGRLSSTIGFGIEDIARVVLPGYLSRHYGIESGELERRFIETDEKTGPIEIDLYGEGTKNGKKVIIIGESKTRIYENEVRKFYSNVESLKGKFKDDILLVMFSFFIHPSAVKIAKEKNIILVASYQR